jgi:hypothetical protein
MVTRRGAGVHHVERSGGQVRSPSVGLDHLHAHDFLLLDEAPRRGHMVRVSVDSHHCATGCNALGHEVEDASRAAPQVDRPVARP